MGKNDDLFGDMEENEESFAELFAQSELKTKPLVRGQQVDATILKISGDWIFLDVGQKGEGVLDRRELTDAEGRLTAVEGDVIKAYFLSRKEGELMFTTRLGRDAGSAQLQEAHRSGIPVDGTIEKEVKGGFEVRISGSRAFCPFSQVSLRGGAKADELMGQKLAFRITQYSENGRNIVVSRRAILEQERLDARDALKATLKEGSLVKGRVVSLRDFGAFVDIGGIDGLLPISELCYGRVKDIREVLTEGQEVEVSITSLDWDANRFSFSLKHAIADPWQSVPLQFPEGSVHNGKVVRLAPFGAFVQLAEGVDGLIHISRIGAGKRISHPREVLSEGQQLQVKVEKIDNDQKRISLVLPGDKEEASDEVVDFSQFLKQGDGGGMGTLGDLLKRSQDKKKKR